MFTSPDAQRILHEGRAVLDAANDVRKRAIEAEIRFRIDTYPVLEKKIEDEVVKLANGLIDDLRTTVLP